MIAKKLQIKITKIGNITYQSNIPGLILKKGRKIRVNQKGYYHQF
jgi:hypothetical protein